MFDISARVNNIPNIYSVRSSDTGFYKIQEILNWSERMLNKLQLAFSPHKLFADENSF